MTTKQTKVEDEKPADPFDPARLRLSESTQIGVKKALTVISCGKPNRQQFVRVHPSEDYRMQTALFTDEVNREAYLVAPELWNELAGEIQPTYLFAAITKTTNNVFVAGTGPFTRRLTGTSPARLQWRLRNGSVFSQTCGRKYDVFEPPIPIPSGPICPSAKC